VGDDAGRPSWLERHPAEDDLDLGEIVPVEGMGVVAPEDAEMVLREIMPPKNLQEFLEKAPKLISQDITQVSTAPRPAA